MIVQKTTSTECEIEVIIFLKYLRRRCGQNLNHRRLRKTKIIIFEEVNQILLAWEFSEWGHILEKIGWSRIIRKLCINYVYLRASLYIELRNRFTALLVKNRSSQVFKKIALVNFQLCHDFAIDAGRSFAEIYIDCTMNVGKLQFASQNVSFSYFFIVAILQEAEFIYTVLIKISNTSIAIESKVRWVKKFCLRIHWTIPYKGISKKPRLRHLTYKESWALSPWKVFIKSVILDCELKFLDNVDRLIKIWG